MNNKMDETKSKNACLSEDVNNSSTSAKSQKLANRMTWDNEKDLLLIGEVILARPFEYRAGTRERGKAWQEVADRLKDRNLKVDKRAVRDRITNLMEKQREKNRREKAASGIAVEETDEEKKIRDSLEDFIQQEEDVENEGAPRERGDEEKKRMEGAEMRKRACKTMGETKKRHQEESITPTKRHRNTGADSLFILQRKMEMEQEFRREEVMRRREEEEKRKQEEREKEQRFELQQQQQLQQQHQFQQQMQQHLLQQQQFMQQQAQQTQTMMMALMKLIEKKD